MASKQVDEIIMNILDEPSILNENGDIPLWSSKIWKSVANSLNKNAQDGQKIISYQYLYTLIKENRYDILDNIRSKLGISRDVYVSDQKSKSDITNSSSSGCSDIKFNSQFSSRKCNQTKQFKVVILYDLFKKRAQR